jgi:vancomycin aglycone glucosyltransferase
MRALVSCVGTRGDVHPAVALAEELRRSGCAVRLCVPPNFVAWARERGFEATPIGVEMRGPSGATPTPTPEQIKKLGEDLIRDQFDVVHAASEGGDVIVGAGMHQYATRSVSELRGVPCVNAVYSPSSIPSGDWTETRRAWNARALGRVNENRERWELAAVDDVIDHILGELPWLAADATLGPAPVTSNRIVFQTGAWILHDASPLPPELEKFLGAGDAPLYFGFGSMPAAKETSRPLIEAARRIGRRAILSRGWAELESIDDAPDCLVIDDVNHRLLFPRVAAVVHHGGAGTTATAARAGTPQVIVPMFGDQFYWGSRVQELGIGRTIEMRSLTVDALVDSLRNTLGLEGRARSISGAIAVDGAAVAARRLIEELGSGS